MNKLKHNNIWITQCEAKIYNHLLLCKISIINKRWKKERLWK